MERVTERYKNSTFVQVMRRAFFSWCFPVLTAVVLLASYYLSLDLVAYWYLGICGVLILATCKDATPFFLILLLLNLPISYKNTPSDCNPVPSDYYMKTANIVQLFTIAFMLIAAVMARIVISVYKKQFKITPLFISVCAFALTLLINGIFSKGYTYLSLVYGLALGALYILLFMLFYSNARLGEGGFKRLAIYFLTLFAIVSVELFTSYFTCSGFIVNGKIADRGKLFLGWGTYNNVGVLLAMTVPAWFYLSKRAKRSWLWLCGATINLLVCFMTTSRQTMLVSVIVYTLCCVWSLIAVKGEARKRNINVIIISYVAVAAFAALVMGDEIASFFRELFEGYQTGSGRIELWKKGITNFLHWPLFGVGFNSGSSLGASSAGIEAVPAFYHNTVVQLLSSCGIVGLIAYAAHRVITVKSFFKNVNGERVFLVLSALGIILCSLLDVHIFSPFGAIIYMSMLPLLALSEEKRAVQEEGAEGALVCVFARRKPTYGGYILKRQTNQQEKDKEKTMEEEKSLTFGDVCKIVLNKITAVVAIALVAALAFGIFFGLFYNKSKQSYSISYELTYPISDSKTYPDNTPIIASDFISLSVLNTIKSGALSDEENKDEFSGVDVKTMYEKSGITIEEKVVSNADNTVSTSYKVTVKAKYFSSPQSGEDFLRAIANFPIRHMLSVIEDNKFDQYLLTFDGATSYEDAISALLKQKDYVITTYEKISLLGGSQVSQNLARVENIFTDKQQKLVENRIKVFHYYKQAEVEKEIRNNELVLLNKEIASNVQTIAALEDKRAQAHAAGATGEALKSYEDEIARLVVENQTKEMEINEINEIIAAIDAYTTEGTDEYTAKQELDASLSAYRKDLSDATAQLQSTLLSIYAKNGRVVYNGGFKTSGGISMIIAVILGAIVGFLLSALVVCVMDAGKYKRVKYGIDVEPEEGKKEEEPAPAAASKEASEELPSEDEKLITVTDLIGDDKSDDMNGEVKIDSDEKLELRIEGVPEILPPIPGDSKEEAIKEEEKAEEPKPAAKKAPAKKPATKSSAAKKPAAKKPAAAKPSASKTSSAKKPATKSSAAKKPAAKKPAAAKPSASKTSSAKKPAPKKDE